MSTRRPTFAFAGGEVTPEFWGQVTDAKYQIGLALAQNIVCLAHGPARNRPGFAYVRAVKTPAKRTRLIPFTYSTDQTMVLEFGDQYVRFHTMGATLFNAGVPYEVVTPYLEADLFDIHYVQSADVLTLCHPGYAPRELRRNSAVSWSLATISFVSSLAAPGSPVAVATVGAGSTNYSYKVTSVNATGLEESAASSASSPITNNLLVSGNYNTFSWASTSATRYNVYKQSNGLFGYIGQTDSTSFVDDNITPDMSKTPPVVNNPFSSSGYYPGAVSYFEQRRAFAGSTNEPQNLRMTRSGTESNLNYSLPTRDDDSINFRVAAREANTIRHIVPLANMVLLTASAEWRVTSVNSDAITPTSVSVKPQSYVGASNVQPVVVTNNIVYGAARGGHLREMAFNSDAGGYITGDLSLRAPHLFDGYAVTDLAYSKAPYPLVWAISSSGNLIGMTYVPEQQVGAMHHHITTGGTFESCCVVAEGDEDVLYVVTNRTINGAQTRFVERMSSWRFAAQADAFFVDAGLTYSGAPATTISGLTWLEGETVNVLGDGAVFLPRVVSGGAITLERACSKVQVGLPIVADMQTLPLAAQVDNALGQGRLKNVNKVVLRVSNSSGVSAGPSLTQLRQAKQRTNEPYGAPPRLVSDDIEITLDPSWQSGGQVFVRQDQPLPLTVTSLTIEAEIGG